MRKRPPKGCNAPDPYECHLGREHEPDPFALLITSYVILRRAEFLLQPAGTRGLLTEAASDYAFHARQLIDASGAVSPFAADPDETPEPAEILLETGTQLLLGQRILKPDVGMEIRIFCLKARDEASLRMGYEAGIEGTLAVMGLIQHPDGRWQVLHVEVDPSLKRQAIATQLYDCVERLLDCKLTPSGWLSDDAYRFWQNRGHWVIGGYRQVDYFHDMWMSPKVLVTLSAIERVKMDALKQRLN